MAGDLLHAPVQDVLVILCNRNDLAASQPAIRPVDTGRSGEGGRAVHGRIGQRDDLIAGQPHARIADSCALRRGSLGRKTGSGDLHAGRGRRRYLQAVVRGVDKPVCDEEGPVLGVVAEPVDRVSSHCVARRRSGYHGGGPRGQIVIGAGGEQEGRNELLHEPVGQVVLESCRRVEIGDRALSPLARRGDRVPGRGRELRAEVRDVVGLQERPRGIDRERSEGVGVFRSVGELRVVRGHSAHRIIPFPRTRTELSRPVNSPSSPVRLPAPAHPPRRPCSADPPTLEDLPDRLGDLRRLFQSRPGFHPDRCGERPFPSEPSVAGPPPTSSVWTLSARSTLQPICYGQNRGRSSCRASRARLAFQTSPGTRREVRS